MRHFFQKNFFIKKKFTFTENGIDQEFSDNDGTFSLFVRYEDILSKEYVKVNTKKKGNVLKFGLLISLLTLLRGFIIGKSDWQTTVIVVILSLLIALGTYLYYSLTKEIYYSIRMKEKFFQVLYDKPSPLEAKKFVDEIFERRKKYFRDKYFIVNNKNYKEDEIDKFEWLKSENFITVQEYNDSLNKINSEFKNLYS